MVEIRADSLEEAYKKASKELGVSVVDLDIEIVQAPRGGFLGLFKKSAIIIARSKIEQKGQIKSSDAKSDKNIEDEIKDSIKELLKNSCFEIELKDISVKEDEVSVVLDGKDAALLIGKEGYRYKALSYMLHNWLMIKYDKNISLEIGEFIKNQSEAIDKYIDILKVDIDKRGYGQTKALDGILIKLALNRLREIYPNKYVAIKSLKDGRKKVVVNDFNGEKR